MTTKRESLIPRAVVNYKNRHDTEYTKKRKVFKGRAGGTRSGDNPVICTSGVNDFNDKLSNTTPETTENVETEINDTVGTEFSVTVEEANTHSTETSNENDGLSEGVEFIGSDDDTDSFEESEITVEAVVETFSAVSSDMTKKELIAYANSNDIPVKDWWGKQKILDALNN